MNAGYSMRARRHFSFFFTSILFHVFILGILVLGFHFSSPLPVLQNTNKNDVISAVILGDSPDSKILPQKASVKPVQEMKEDKAKTKLQNSDPVVPTPKPIPIQKPKPDVISLKIDVEKKIMEAKALEEKRRHELLAKDLLADIKTQSNKQKKIKHKQLKAHFEKTLREQSEITLRQQLLNENLRLKGTLSKEAQGEINKFKALILQSISENWIVPVQANKKLHCELLIRLAPSGLVLDVQITKSSGDKALDRSARAAVLKASPLPVPKDEKAFEPFRQFSLTVTPETLTNLNA